MLSADMELQEHLKEHFGYNAFRPHQEEIISSLLHGRDVLAILPTGAGKSLCYQLPALIQEGIAIVISPLIALMQDQVVSLYKSGIPAAFLNSSLPPQEMHELMGNLGNYKMLFVAPERFADSRFIEKLKSLKVSFFAIDEAHCISQWGHSFRPEYRQLHFIKEKFPQSPVLALTATATPEVEKDIAQQLVMKNPVVIKGSFDRPNLTIRINQKMDTGRQLREFLSKYPEESGIIYCGTRKLVDETYTELRSSGFSVGRYHGGMSDSDRAQMQHAFLYDEAQIMVATVAFGMGIHKSDIRFIVHLSLPQSMEQYYQEIGRAGRDGMPSECLLLTDNSDYRLFQYFLSEIKNEDERQRNKKKMDQIFSLTRSYACRRQDLLKYFGESYPKKNCNSCDNCLDVVSQVDGTVIAQKILSCIYRMEHRYGAKMVIEVLRGSKSQKVLSRRFDQLSTYNLMPEFSEEELGFYIQELINMDYLQRAEGEYPVLQWTEQSLEVVKGNVPVLFRKREFRKRKVVDPLVKKHDTDLFHKLRMLRLEISHKEEIPPYIVFSDRTLLEMAANMPQNMEQMLEINGVGPQKWARFGKRFLDTILTHG